jgi:DNA-directed RNA polymerase
MKKPEISRIWMVLRESAQSTSFRHHSKRAAVNEAHRLARIFPGENFYVLASICAFRTKEPEIVECKLKKQKPHVQCEDDGIPF